MKGIMARYRTNTNPWPPLAAAWLGDSPALGPLAFERWCPSFSVGRSVALDREGRGACEREGAPPSRRFSFVGDSGTSKAPGVPTNGDCARPHFTQAAEVMVGVLFLGRIVAPH